MVWRCTSLGGTTCNMCQIRIDVGWDRVGFVATRKRADSDPLIKAFCMTVQERREVLGISQEEVAHRAGLHRTYISDIERGARNISLKNLGRLAAALEIPIWNLIRNAEQKADIMRGESVP